MKDLKSLIPMLTVEEKAALVAGTDFITPIPLRALAYRLSVCRTDRTDCVCRTGAVALVASGILLSRKKRKEDQ